MLTIRPLKSKSELNEYMDLCVYCFSMQASYTSIYASFIAPYLKHTMGAFVDGRLMACMWYIPYEMNVGGAYIPMGGVAAVATYPEARNLGLAKKLMSRAHQQMKAEGRPLAALMPFKPEFYARMGYGDVFYYQSCKLRPEGLQRPLPRGYSVVRVDPDKDWKTFDRLHSEYSARYFGAVKRPHSYWKVRYFNSVIGVRYHYLIMKGKEPAGFIITHVDKPAPAYSSDLQRPTHLSIIQAAWTNTDALNTFLNFVYVHRDQFRTVNWYAPPDIPLRGLDPQMELTLKPKMMLKLVDLKSAIEARPFASDLEGELILNVKGDDTSLWNDGVWRVQWKKGKAKVTKTKSASRLPRLKTDIQTLSILYSGHRSASELAGIGLLSGPRPGIELLDRAFPKQPCHIDEWF